MIVGSSLFFPMIHMKYVVFMSLWPCTIKILISNWPRTKIQPVFLKIQARKTFSYHGHELVTLYVQFLCSDWSKFDRWVHTENLCSILKVDYFDSWSWQSVVSTCDVFNCLFPLDVQNEIQLLSKVLINKSLRKQTCSNLHGNKMNKGKRKIHKENDEINISYY